jgi:hypothetical protein
MLSKISMIGLLSLMVLNSPLMLFAQDSWTDSWQLIWEYDDADVVNDTVTAFDIYKGLSSNPIKIADSVNSSERSWRDNNNNIQPNTSYYYRVTARNKNNISSDYSSCVSAAIPYILEAMDTIFIKGDSSFSLDIHVVDKDYDEDQYRDSLSWLVNDKNSFNSPDDDLLISITADNIATFDVKKDSFKTLSVFFSVIDPDSFYYKKSTVVKYTASLPADTSKPQPPDSSGGYNPAEETIAYPVPFRASLDDNGITFDNIPPGGSLLIFDMMGDKVFEVNSLSESKYQWDVKNNYGKNISSGLYIFHVRTSNGSKIDSGKVVIIR